MPTKGPLITAPPELILSEYNEKSGKDIPLRTFLWAEAGCTHQILVRADAKAG